MIVDYHMHLRGPVDGREGAPDFSVTAVERYVHVAGEQGLQEIGFTEHLYYFTEFAGLLEHPYQKQRARYELDTYCDAILAAKRQGLPVKLGLEVEFLPGREAEIARILDDYPWDFLIGSVHLVDGEAVDLRPGIWDRLAPAEVWGCYFTLLGDLARSGLVDVLAHPDLVKIFGNGTPGLERADIYEEAATAIGESGVAIEISTAGLRKPVAELYPAQELLHACRAHRAPITIASDAHAPQYVGRDFDQALTLARQGGYETLTVFDRRAARQEPLG